MSALLARPLPAGIPPNRGDGPRPGRRRALVDLAVLGGLGLALVALAAWMAGWPGLNTRPRAFLVALVAQLAVYGLASAWVIRRRPRPAGALVVIVLVALAARLILVGTTPSASDDLYRYIWDGRIQAQGINPYRFPPSDPALAAYRDGAIYPLINRKGAPTIYPPVAQAVFRALYAIHPDSVAWTKLAFAGVDLLTILIVAGLLARLGLRPERAILYAWHPLAILEVAGSGHVDAVAILFLVLAVWARLAGRPYRAGFLLACAVLTKFYALVALPALLRPERRRDLRLPLTTAAAIGLAYLPFLAVGGRVFGYLGGYVQEEGIASGERFKFVRWAAWLVARAEPPGRVGAFPVDGGRLYAGFLVLALAALAWWCWTRPLPSPRAIPARVALLLATFLILATPSYPWYTLLVLPFAAFAGPRVAPPALALVGGAGFLYLQWWWPGGAGWAAGIAYGAGALALLVAIAGPLGGALARRWRAATTRVARADPGKPAASAGAGRR